VLRLIKRVIKFPNMTNDKKRFSADLDKNYSEIVIRQSRPRSPTGFWWSSWKTHPQINKYEKYFQTMITNRIYKPLIKSYTQQVDTCVIISRLVPHAPTDYISNLPTVHKRTYCLPTQYIKQLHITHRHYKTINQLLMIYYS